MKVRCKALKRGTKVSPSTGQQVHFDPDAQRYPLAREPLIDERDVEFFVDEGFIDEPAADAERVGVEREREIYEAEARGGVSQSRRDRRGRRRAGGESEAGERERSNKRRTSQPGADRAAERVAKAAPADARAGGVNSGLDTRQSRNYAPDDNPGTELNDEGGKEDGGEGGLSLRDPASPPVERPRRGTGARAAPAAAAAKPAARKPGGRAKAGA